MELKYIVTIVVILSIEAGVLVKGNLVCYQCKDCEEISDDQAKVCQPHTTTTEQSSTTQGTTEGTTEGTTTTPEPERMRSINISPRAALSLETYCYEEHIKGTADKPVVNRGCTNDKDYCQEDLKHTYCETCETDRCNSGVVHGKGYIEVIALVATNLFISTVLSVSGWR